MQSFNLRSSIWWTITFRFHKVFSYHIFLWNYWSEKGIVFVNTLVRKLVMIINTAAGYFVSIDKRPFGKCSNSASKWNGTNLKEKYLFSYHTIFCNLLIFQWNKLIIILLWNNCTSKQIEGATFNVVFSIFS